MHDSGKIKKVRQEALANVQKAESLGRYPANFVLVHDKNCLRTTEGACATECPVFMLDRQSADKVHSAGFRREGSGDPNQTNSSMFFQRSHESTGMRYGDHGTAARFFFQADNTDELSQYLEKMIQGKL